MMPLSRIPTWLRPEATIVITGGNGMVGRALQAELRDQGCVRILVPSRGELDLLDSVATHEYFREHRPRLVFHLASVVFGLFGNMKNQFLALADNTLLNHNVLTACAAVGVRKIFFAGTVAAYPFPYQGLPLAEAMLWEGVPHYGEFGYANAKRHALAYLEILRREADIDFFYGLLTNLYGPGDRFDDRFGHVVPSLIVKLNRAKWTGEPFQVWGDGSATRDFMHARDAARAILLGMERISGVANISSGVAVPIRDVVAALVRAARYRETVAWQTDKPVGVPERSVSNAVLRGIGFECAYTLETGIKDTWDWFERNADSVRTENAIRQSPQDAGLTEA
jgi:GDP-L-fucose synthase